MCLIALQSTLCRYSQNCLTVRTTRNYTFSITLLLLSQKSPLCIWIMLVIKTRNRYFVFLQSSKTLSVFTDVQLLFCHNPETVKVKDFCRS